MRFAFRALVACIVSLSPMLAPAVRAEPVAVLAALEGRATLTPSRGGDRKAGPATFGSALDRGDRIAVAANSRATLLFNDGNVIELGAGSSMTVGGRAAAGNVAGGEKLPREAFASVTNLRISGSREHGLLAAPALRSVGGAATAEPLSPRGTDLLERTPTFHWRAVPGATRYVIRLSGASGELWARDSESADLEFPDPSTPLGDGEYLWEVQAHGANGPLEPTSATFRIVPAIEADAVRAVVARIQASTGGENTPAARYLAGAYLFDHGYLSAATEQFNALIELAPNSAAPHEALGEVYRTAGLPELAAAAFEKARRLSPSN